MSSDASTSQFQAALQRAGIDRSLTHPVMYFLVAGSAWLLISIVFGLLATIKIHNPGFMDDCGPMSFGRVYAAHLNLLIYGWGMQAAFALIIWMMSRMSNKECTMAGSILTGAIVWNVGMVIGFLGILCGYGSGMSWMEFPPFAWPFMLAAFVVILIGSFIQFRVRDESSTVPVAQWYLLASILWFPWVFLTSNILLHCLPGHPVMAAGINAWYKSGLMYLFFTPVGLGAACFITPKVTGRPLYSQSLAMVGFWSLAVIAPWAGMQKLAGAPIPVFLPYLGGAATAMLFIPACAAVMNNLRTMLCDRETLVASPALRFTLLGLLSLLVLTMSGIYLNFPDSTLKASQFSIASYGSELLGLYGFFSSAVFGAVYYMVPRLTRREWLSRSMIRWHFLFSLYGTVSLVVVVLFGGCLQGDLLEKWDQPWAKAALSGSAYAYTITFAWCMILLSNLLFFAHLLLMWLRLGRRSQHPTLLVNPPAADSSQPAAH